jgi:membrane-bound ClpP family serine protease
MTVSPIVIIVLVLSSCLSALLIFITSLSRHRKAGYGALDLLGLIARVETKLEPEGAIILNGELWRACVSNRGMQIGPGCTVRVVGVRGHLLVVECAD